jgi:hypothetical protein
MKQPCQKQERILLLPNYCTNQISTQQESETKSTIAIVLKIAASKHKRNGGFFY